MRPRRFPGQLTGAFPEFEATPLNYVLGQFDIDPDEAVTAGGKGERVVWDIREDVTKVFFTAL